MCCDEQNALAETANGGLHHHPKPVSSCCGLQKHAEDSKPRAFQPGSVMIEGTMNVRLETGEEMIFCLNIGVGTVETDARRMSEFTSASPITSSAAGHV